MKPVNERGSTPVGKDPADEPNQDPPNSTQSSAPRLGDLPVNDVVSEAASERRDLPTTAVEAANLADVYDKMLRLADLFEDSGERMREWAQLGHDVLTDPDLTESAPLSPKTYADAEIEIHDATTGKAGLLARSVELDADALVLRATVLTYQWIDELQSAAYDTLGSIAGRAIGYLAPEVTLGGTIVAAGLIETDSLDRDGVAAYLNELAEANPELMEHVTTGGGLVDSLQMRALVTAGVPSGEAGDRARAGGLRATGITTLPTDFDAALRDAAIGITEDDIDAESIAAAGAAEDGPPSSLTDLMTVLAATTESQRIVAVAPGRWIVYLPGPVSVPPSGDRPRLVSGDTSQYVDEVIRVVGETVTSPQDRVLLVGTAGGGAAAIEIAARPEQEAFVVDHVVTASAPSAHAPRLPGVVRVLSLEDRADPVALLGSLINVDAPNRLTVVFDSTGAAGAEAGVPSFVLGARAADRSGHPEVIEELARLRELGYLG